jgi:hypothetical protein
MLPWIYGPLIASAMFFIGGAVARAAELGRAGTGGVIRRIFGGSLGPAAPKELTP